MESGNWTVELVTNHTGCNIIEIEASNIIKQSFQTIEIDGELWTLPDNNIGLSFAQILSPSGKDHSQVFGK